MILHSRGKNREIENAAHRWEGNTFKLYIWQESDKEDRQGTP